MYLQSEGGLRKWQVRGMREKMGVFYLVSRGKEPLTHLASLYNPYADIAS